jgi:hypothetical protein
VVRAKAAWTTAKPALAFLATWAFLDAVLNVRYPAAEPKLWYLIPSIDILVLFGVYAVLGLLRVRVHYAVHIGLVVLVVFARLLRVGDAVESDLNRSFNLYTDLALLPELVRLFYATIPRINFVLAAAGVVIALGGLVFLVHRALRLAEQLLRRRRNVILFSSVTFALALVSLFDPHWEPQDGYSGAFTASAVPRLEKQVDFFVHLGAFRRDTLRAVKRVQRQLDKTPTDLANLHHANVLLFLVESYGQTVIDRPYFAQRIHAVYNEIDTNLGRKGFFPASGLLDSPTYGGGSWLAHATLATAVRTTDQWHYDLVRAASPKTLAQFFHNAGYRTVFVQANTTRRAPPNEFLGFDDSYYAWSFDYAGPQYSWATMPDQYIVDFIRRREVASAAKPLFIQYALISSHGPWNAQPPFLEDWSAVGDGAIFWKKDTVYFPINWSNLPEASEAYIHSIEYDLRMLASYVTEFVRDDSLVIILGDHQPAAAVTQDSPSHGVPIHVMSRNPALVAPFLARGYVRGMTPLPQGSPDGMENFVTNFLRDFSSPKQGQL